MTVIIIIIIMLVVLNEYFTVDDDVNKGVDPGWARGAFAPPPTFRAPYVLILPKLVIYCCIKLFSYIP